MRNDVELKHVLCSVMYATLFVCYVLNILVLLNIVSCFSPELKCTPKKWIWFKERLRTVHVPCFSFRFGVCISFHEWILLPVFHASMCLGSHILAARWRHQSRVWNCSKSQALGWFVICYITYPANKVSLESAACFYRRMERNTPVSFTYCKTKCLCPTKTFFLCLYNISVHLYWNS